jgi:hypothetical protein
MGSDFLNKILFPEQGIKARIHIRDYSKLNSFCTAKETIRAKRQPFI